MSRRVLTAIVALAWCAPAHAQLVVSGITRDTIRVGDPFRAVVRIDVAPGTEVILPDSLPAAEDIENAGRVRTRRDSTDQRVTVIAAYPLTAWRPGSLPLPDFSVLTRAEGRERSVDVDLPAITVVSVLPADTTNIQAKPPKDVFGANRLWWLWLLAALLLLAALAAAYWWWRKRRKPEAAPIPLILPRAQALEELDRVAQLGLIEQGEFKRFYTLVSEILRRYLQTYDAKWSSYLTTEELAERVRKERDIAPAINVLRSSDLVKFARSVPGARDAHGDWQKARDWVSGFRPEPTTELEAA